MKKIIVLSLFASLFFAGCKKDPTVVSSTVEVSYPTISISGNPYYSIQVNGALPTIQASAYDSVLRTPCTVILDQSSLDNTTPGLYTVTASAKNKYGMTAYKTIFVGVTNVPATLDISGVYWRLASPNRVANVTKLATGMFMTDNVGGVDITTQASSIFPAVFVVTSNTTLTFGSQQISAGTLTSASETLNLATPITFSYILTNPSTTFSNTAVRTFVHQ